METITKQKKKNPQTLNDRLEKLSKKNNIPPLTRDQKLELGKTTAQKFYDSTKNWDKHKPYLGSKEIEENGEKFRVRLYPSFFVPTLDALIFEYLKTKGIYEKV